MADMIFNKTTLNIGNNAMNFSTDTIKCALVTVEPVVTWEGYTDITNEFVGTGYTVGGVAVAVTWANSGVVAKLDSENPIWDPITATGLLYAIFYSDTSTGKKLICAKDFGGAQSVTDNEFEVKVDDAGLISIP